MKKRTEREVMERFLNNTDNDKICWTPRGRTKSVRYDGRIISLTHLSFIVSKNSGEYRKKQEIVRTCGNSECFNPDHILFDEMDRFKWYIETNEKTGCWNWTRGKDGGGYGVFFSCKYGREKTHRISYMENFGDVPEGMFVCHTCDNPSCCNPEHLFLGSNQDNIDDKVRKNRQSRLFGVRNGRAILSEETVRSIRNDYQSGTYSYRDLVKKYSISQTQIARIVKEESWEWVKT